MVNRSIFMTGAFIVGIAAAFAFKTDANKANTNNLLSNQTVYYGTPCESSVLCSDDSSQPECVIGQTTYDDQGTCMQVSAFQFKAIP